MASREELETLAAEIAYNNDGSFHLEFGEEYEALTKEEQSIVFDLVWEDLANCDECGWHFLQDNLEVDKATGDCLCWQCHSQREDEEEEE